MLKYLFQDINIVVEYLAFLISFFGPELRDKQKINRKMFPILAFFFVGIYSLHFIYWAGKDQVAWILAIWAFGMSYVLFDICTKNLVVWGIGIFLMIVLLENMWNVILFRLLEDTYIGMNVGIFLSTFFSIVFWKVNKGKERMLSELSIKEWLNVDAILMVITFMMTFFSVIVADTTFHSARIAGEVIIVAGSIAIIVLLFQLLFMYEKKVDYKVQEEISKKAVLMQKQYFEKILEKEDDTRAFRHELINELFITTKKDKKNHGYGIRNMIEVIEKYGGEYQFGYEDEEYIAEVWLKYKK